MPKRGQRRRSRLQHWLHSVRLRILWTRKLVPSWNGVCTIYLGHDITAERRATRETSTLDRTRAQKESGDDVSPEHIGFRNSRGSGMQCA